MALFLRHYTRKIITTTIHKPILYGDDASPPVRFVRMTASILNIDLDYRKVDLFKGENRLDFYKNINPLQKVPALVVKSNVIIDSHAIAIYLCQLVEDQTLYPDDGILKAKVNEMMFYNASLLFPIDSRILSDFFAGNTDYFKKYDEWYSALDYLDMKLKDTKWLAGDRVTLCDLCIVSTVSSMQQLTPLTERHARVSRWVQELEQLPFYEINKISLRRLAQFINLAKLNIKQQN